MLKGYKHQFSQRTNFYMVIWQRGWNVSWSATWQLILCISIGSKHGSTFLLLTTSFHMGVFGGLYASSFISPHFAIQNPHLLQKLKAKSLQTDLGLLAWFFVRICHISIGNFKVSIQQLFYVIFSLFFISFYECMWVFVKC